jgi:hypothetical protein
MMPKKGLYISPTLNYTSKKLDAPKKVKLKYQSIGNFILSNVKDLGLMQYKLYKDFKEK